MIKDIYEVMNRIDTDFEEYPEIKFTDYEKQLNAKRILSKIQGENMKKGKFIHSQGIQKKIAVACIIIVIGASIVTTVSFASEGRLFHNVYTFFNGSKITFDYDEETGESSSSVELNATQNPPVTLDGDRLYFCVNESQIDITDLISNEVPYIGEYVDDQNMIHKFIIGGEPKEDAYGYEEHLFDSNGISLGSSGCYGSKVKDVGTDEEPQWLVDGRSKIGKNY